MRLISMAPKPRFATRRTTNYILWCRLPLQRYSPCEEEEPS
ncbi:hypothetical protein G647_02989 [Cladophialophora carrionii CBS 160.54]|uniref:Uncharacterized protein n=1 Tax=Cladophialophora carrionii CBS 160.54 TaxID=1279043 RepID=V9DJU3_9EURO|nr:uncharacterized protein G647_02989 [Cladophialophora carrionii CBS 160.54]ETI26212.1 hypothetical protein G647_02989 [Cladophialophora carrionii CBS 160.54]